jgi:hypothetical protein
VKANPTPTRFGLGCQHFQTRCEHAGRHSFLARFGASFLLSRHAVPYQGPDPLAHHPTLQAQMSATADVKARYARLATVLNKIASDSNATFADPRGVFFELIFAGHEINAAEFKMRTTWWPIGSGLRR